MPSRFVPYRYHNYTDVLIAVGTAELSTVLFGHRPEDVRLSSEPAGFRITHPEGEKVTEASPFQQIRDKESRKIDESLPADWDKTQVDDDMNNPRWWTTVSVINSLASPRFNNKLARQYTPKLGQALLDGSAKVKTNSKSQLLYAHTSKGVNKSGFSRGIATTQGNIGADAEQMIALLGYQVGASGYIKDDYTISVVPRPKSITLKSYRNLVSNFLRGYLPRTNGGKILPTRDQTVPFFMAMAYFDFIIELFNYHEDTPDMMGRVFDGVGNIIESLDRSIYFSMGTSSAPFATDSLAIPRWLDKKGVAVNVRNLVREMLSERPDPKMLYLPVRAFAESDPRPLVDFYRKYEPLKKPSGGNRTSKTLLHEQTLEYVMAKTNYDDLSCDEMRRFANAIRSRTYNKLYHGDQPDYNLLTKLRSASRNNDQLVNMLSEFIGSYNLHNARQSAVDKQTDGKNLRYEDLQVIIGLIEKYDAKFVADTLMAQAMSKPDKEKTPEKESASA
jgi:hypothetical protein